MIITPRTMSIMGLPLSGHSGDSECGTECERATKSIRSPAPNQNVKSHFVMNGESASVPEWSGTWAE